MARINGSNVAAHINSIRLVRHERNIGKTSMLSRCMRVCRALPCGNVATCADALAPPLCSRPVVAVLSAASCYDSGNDNVGISTL